MKNSIILSLTVGLLGSSLLATTARAANLVSNQVADPGFELGINSSTGLPYNWAFSQYNETSASVAISTSTVVEGSNSAQLNIAANSTGATPYVQLLSNSIPLQYPASSYPKTFYFKVRVNYQGKIQAMNLRALWYDSNGAQITGTDCLIWNQTLNYNNSALAGWQLKTASMAVPIDPITRLPAATSVRLQLQVTSNNNDTGTVYLDDVYAGPVGDDQMGNRLANPGFEMNNTTPLVDNWPIAIHPSSGSAPTVTQDTSVKLEGSSSLKIAFPSGTTTSGNYAGVLSDNVNVRPGDTYAARFFMNYSGTFSMEPVIAIYWYSSSGSALASPNAFTTLPVSGAPTITNSSSTLSNWCMLEGSVTAPAGAYSARVQIRVLSTRTTTGDNAVFYFDNCYLGSSIAENSSFEYNGLASATPPTGWTSPAPDGWAMSSSSMGAGVTYTYDNTVSNDGQVSAHISVPVGAPSSSSSYVQFLSTREPLVPANSVTGLYSITGRYSTRYSGKINQVSSQILFYDASGTLMSYRPSIWGQVIAYNSSTPSGWSFHELTAIPPAGAVSAALLVRFTLASNLANYGDMWLDSTYLGLDRYQRVTNNNLVEDILDPMYFYRGDANITWKPSIIPTTSYWLSTNSTGLAINYLYAGSTSPTAVSYKRTFNTDLENIYTSLIIHASTSATAQIKVTATYLDTSNSTVVTPVTVNGDGLFHEISVPFTNPRTLLSVELEVNDLSTALPDTLNTQKGATVHWIMLRKPGSEPAPSHTFNPQKSPVDSFSTDIPVGLLFSQSDVTGLRNKIASGAGKDQWIQLKARVDADLSYIPENDINDYLSPESNQAASTSRDDNKLPLSWPSKIRELALAYVLTQASDPTTALQYADMARRIMLTAADTPNWSASFMWRRPLNDPETFHNAPFHESEMTEAMCEGYDWIYNTLTDAERGQILGAIQSKGMQYIDTFLSYQIYWKEMNQGILFSSPYAIGAITLAQGKAAGKVTWDPVIWTVTVAGVPYFRQPIDIVQKAEDDLQITVNNYYFADGDTPEGPAYWGSTTTALTTGMDALLRAETAFRDPAKPTWEHDLETTGLSNTFEYLMYNSSMAASVPLVEMNYGQANYGGQLNPNQVASFFGGFGATNPLAQWELTGTLNSENYMASYGVWGNAALTLLFYEPTVTPTAPQLSRYKYLAGTGLLFERSDWEFGHAIMFSLISGAWSAGHSHLDKNAFVIEAYGTRFAVDRGTTLYSDPQLPDYEATKSHNAITLNDNGNGSQDQVYFAGHPAALMKTTFTSPIFDFSTSDATAAYDPATMTACLRSVIYARPDVFFLLDEVTPTAASGRKVEWNLRTLQSNTGSGNTLMFQQGTSACLGMQFLYPSSITMATEQSDKGDGNALDEYKNVISVTNTSGAMTPFLVAMRPAIGTSSGMTTMTIDSSVTQVNVPSGAFLVRYGTNNTTINSDAKICLLFTPTSSAAVTQVGMMGGTTLTYGASLISSSLSSGATANVAVEWTSSSTARGKVQTTGAGTVTLTSPFNSSVQITLTFSGAGDQWVSSSDGALDVVRFLNSHEDIDLGPGVSRQLSIEVRTNDDTVLTTGTTVTYSSSNTGVATVSSTGVLTPVSAGPATITASVILTGGGVTRVGTTSVTVEAALNGNFLSADNPGFESPATGNPYPDWSINGQNGASITLDTTSADAHSGSNSVQLLVPSSIRDGLEKAQIKSSLVQVTAKVLYDAQFWYKASATVAVKSTGLNSLLGTVAWYDAQGNRIVGEDDVIVNQPIIPGSPIPWTRADSLVSAPDNAVYAQFLLSFFTDLNDNAELWLDDFALTSNLLANGGFETVSTGLPSNWTSTSTVGHYTSITFNTVTGAEDGDGMLEEDYVTSSGNGSVSAIEVLSDQISLTDPSTSTVATTVNVRISKRFQGYIYNSWAYIQWYDTPTHVLSSTPSTTVDSTATFPAYNSSTPSGWIVVVNNSISVPTGALYARLALRNHNNSMSSQSGTIWYDDVFLGF